MPGLASRCPHLGRPLLLADPLPLGLLPPLLLALLPLLLLQQPLPLPLQLTLVTLQQRHHLLGAHRAVVRRDAVARSLTVIILHCWHANKNFVGMSSNFPLLPTTLENDYSDLYASIAQHIYLSQCGAQRVVLQIQPLEALQLGEADRQLLDLVGVEVE